MAISKALSALAGIARGGKALIEKEEERTAEVSKLGLQQTLKNIATAKENHLTTMKEFREKMRGVKSLQMWTYKDPETGVARKLSQGQAIALIEATGGVKEASAALEKAEIAFKGEGEVGPIQYTTSGALDQETVEAFTEDDEKVGVAPLSLAKGRNARAMADIQKVIDTLGLPKDGYQTPVGLPEVSGVQIVSLKGKDGDTVKAIGSPILLFNRDQDNNPIDVTPGFRSQDLHVYVYDPKTGTHRKIKENEFETYKHMPTEQQNKTPEPLRTVQTDYLKTYFQSGTFPDARDEYNEMQVGIQKLGLAYEKMWPIAKDRAAYSGIAKFFGNVTNRIQVEVAGIKLFSGGETESKEAIATLDEFIAEQTKNGITQVANKAELLKALIARHAYSYLQANKDSVRPSDADMQRAIEQFSANNPEQFILKARSNWQEITELAKNQREQLLKHPAFTDYTIIEYDEDERQAIEAVVENQKSYISVVPSNAPNFIMNEDAEQQIINTSEPVAGDVKVTLNIQGQSVEATYDPETKEFVVNTGKRVARIPMADAKNKKLITDEVFNELTK